MKIPTFVSLTVYTAVSLTPAAAQTNGPAVYDPPQILKAAPLVENSLTIDVLGIVPGMTATEVGALVKASFGDTWYSEPKAQLGASRNSIRVRSSEYVNEVSASRYDHDNQFQDHISVSMSGVAGGNQAIGLRRHTCYGNQVEHPFLVDVIKSLTDKYGAPSPSLTAPGSLGWAYRDGAKVDFPKGTRLTADLNSYDADMLRFYPENDEATDYRIEAQFELDERDRTRITCMDTSTGSIALRRRAAAADLKILREQLDRAVASHPHVAGPNL